MTPAPEFFAPQSLAIATLLGIRISTLLLVAPVFSASSVPVQIRAAITLVLVAVLFAPARVHAVNVELTMISATTEVVIGFAIGFGAALFVGAAETAGDLMTMQMGLSGASILDPYTNVTVPVLAQFFQLFVVTLMLACDAHLIMIDTLAATLRTFPLGTTLHIADGLRAMVGLGATLLMLGVKMSAPIIGSVLIGNVALALLSRAAPQLNVLSVAFPLQIGLGLFVVATALPVMAGHFTDWSRSYDAVLNRLFSTLANGVS